MAVAFDEVVALVTESGVPSCGFPVDGFAAAMTCTARGRARSPTWRSSTTPSIAACTAGGRRQLVQERHPAALLCSRFAHAGGSTGRTWLAHGPATRDMSQLRYADTVELNGRTVPLGRRATYYRCR